MMGLSDYSRNFANKAVSVLAGLVVSIILARFLSVEARGELAFIVQVSSIVAIVAGMGMGQDFIRRYRNRPVPSTYSRVSSVYLLHFGILATIGFLVAAAGISAGSWLLCYVACLAVVLSAYQQIEAIMSAYDIALKIRVNFLYSILRIASHCVMFVVAPSLIWVPVTIAAFNAAVPVVLYLAIAQRPHLERPSLRLARKMYGFGWLPMISTLLIVLNYSVDMVMLKPLGTAHDLGIYAVAIGVVTYLWVLPDAVKEVLISRVVRKADPKAALRPLKFAVFAAVFSVLVVVLTGWFLVPLLFGAAYYDSYLIIVALSVGVVAMTYYKVLSVLVIAEGKRVFYFACLLVAVLLNVALNAFAIPAYGAMGAAVVSSVTYAFTGLTFCAFYLRIAGLKFRDAIVLSADDIVELRKLLKFRRR